MQLEAFQQSGQMIHILLIVGLASGIATNGENPKRDLTKRFIWSWQRSGRLNSAGNGDELRYQKTENDPRKDGNWSSVKADIVIKKSGV